ncbi:hypothetical protein PINS_up019060 [Pythium insidiosum]|nr:hypothetical protein PINS_up019060 [Pythium insidiosum]
MTKNIYKIRIDHKGRHVGLAADEQHAPQFVDDAGLRRPARVGRGRHAPRRVQL